MSSAGLVFGRHLQKIIGTKLLVENLAALAQIYSIVFAFTPRKWPERAL
jgi:hypothetical protein